MGSRANVDQGRGQLLLSVGDLRFTYAASLWRGREGLSTFAGRDNTVNRGSKHLGLDTTTILIRLEH